MGEQEASDVFAFANHTSLFSVGQRDRPNNNPVQAALHDALLLQFLILRAEVEQERNKKERVKDPESTPAVTYSKVSHTNLRTLHLVMAATIFLVPLDNIEVLISHRLWPSAERTASCPAMAASTVP